MLADLTARIAAPELTRDEIAAAMKVLLDPAVDSDSKACFLRAWAIRVETPAELAACAETLLPLAIQPPMQGSWNGQPLLDCCGTGGGGLNILNISTGIVFILAAMGIPVVKHGNRGLTKKSGSADVLEALGVRIELPPESMQDCLAEVGAAFLFAPQYHTTFSALGAVRRQLGLQGQRTVFNLLGPLLNPARPEARLVGVFSLQHLELYEATLRAMRCPRFTVVCGRDGNDGPFLGEASAHGLTVSATSVGSTTFSGKNLCEHNGAAEDISTLEVRDSNESAFRIERILTGDEKGLARETLLINAAYAACTHGKLGMFAHLNTALTEAKALAVEALDSGRAKDVLDKWRRFSKSTSRENSGLSG